MISILNKFNINFKKVLVVTSAVLAFYFWDFGQKYNLNIDLRYLILIPVLFFFNLASFKNKNFKIILFINLYLILQYLITFFLHDRNFTFNDAKYFAAFILINFFVLFFKDEILRNKYLITKFLIILVPLFFIKVEIISNNSTVLAWNCSFFRAESFLFNLFFLEKSHFGMIALSTILLHSYALIKKFSLLNLSLLLLFFFSLFIFQSTTLVISAMIIIFILILSEYKRLNKKYLFLLSAIFTIYIVVFFSIYGCSRKVTDIVYHHYLDSLSQLNKYEVDKENIKSGKEKSSSSREFQIGYYKNIVKLYKIVSFDKHVETQKLLIFEPQENQITSRKEKIKNVLQKIDISSQVASNSLNIAISTLKKQFYGVGLNRYQDAFMYNIKFQKEKYLDEIMGINRNDGSNNFAKLLAEFGVGAIFIYLYIFIFIFSKKISIENKLFLLPFVITQMLRGAGYFNGGFLMCLILIILLVHERKS